MLILRLLVVMLTLCLPASAHFRLGSHGAASSAPSGVVFSQTVKNIAAATTPTIAGTTMVATHIGTMYPPAAVPSGDIVVAKVGGVTLTNAQIDSQQCSFWPDGSLRFCPFSGFVPQMASGASQQVTFSVQSGSFPTSSSVTPATIAAASDFKVVLSNMNGSWTKQGPQGPSVWYGAYPGFYVSGGAISGGYVRNQPTTAAAPQGLLGFNCASGGANCITSSNYQASVSTTTSSGSAVLTFSSLPVPPQYIFNNPQQITIIDVTNPSAIPDNTTVLSFNGGAKTVTMSANAAANITSGDTLAFGYTIHGGTSNGAFTVNVNGSNIITGVNIIKAGAGFSAVGSGAMTADINVILNAYGSTDPPSCAAMPGAAAFTESFSGSTMTVSSVTGVVSIGQMVDDGTNLGIITAGSGTTWTIQGTLAAGPISATSTPALCVYTSGPTVKAYRGIGAYRDNVSGAKDAWERFRFTIEAWTGPTGLYAIKPVITTDNSVYKNHNGWPNVVYDADFKNGSTEIIGCAQGGSNNKWCAIQQQVNGSWATLDPCEACATGATGRPVMLPATTGTYSTPNSQALAQVVVSPASADLAFIHAARAALPLNNTITVSPAVLTSTTGTFGSPYYTNLYAPYEHGGTDATTGFGSGGSGHIGLGPMGSPWAYWYQAAEGGASDGGVSYLANMRVAAESTAGMMDGPRYDDTGLPLNYFNSGSGYTPPAAFTDSNTWDFVMDQYNKAVSYPNDFMWQGDVPSPTTAQPALANTQIENNDGYGDTSHWPEFQHGIYLVEAERYILENWIDEANGVALGPSNTDGNTRSLSFGGARYDAQGMSSSIPRQNSWWANVTVPVAYLGPPNEPSIQYYKHVVATNYAMNYAFYSFIGTGNFWDAAAGASVWPFPKYYDNTANGDQATPEDYRTTVPNNSSIIDTLFMQLYWGMNTDEAVMFDNGNDANLTGFAHNFLDNYLVKNPAINTCAYNNVAYVIKWANATTHQTAPYVSPQPGWDATTVTGTPQRGNGPISGDNTIHTENGSSTVSASLETAGNTGAWSFTPTATAPVSPGGTSIPLSSVTSPQSGPITTGWVIKDLDNPTALTWPTYVTAPASGLTISISSPVTGPGISINDRIVVSASWPWVYPIFSTTRLASGTRMSIADVDWHDQTSPSDSSQGLSGWPPSSTPQVTDGQWLWLCMDASGAAFGQLSTTQPTISGGVCTGGTTYVTWNITADFGVATIANASCPAASSGDWRNPAANGEEEAEMYATAQWRKALNGVLGTSTDANTAITQLTPYVTPLSTTYSDGQVQWGADDHF